MEQPARTPEPPCYAVVFSSVRTASDPTGYEAMAVRMVELARSMPGFLGVESVRGEDGFGITVSYWKSLESIRHWHQQAEHQRAQALGRSVWYERFQLHVCKVERSYGFERGGG
jgi:heme-degrading monooxygenase HmoA